MDNKHELYSTDFGTDVRGAVDLGDTTQVYVTHDGKHVTLAELLKLYGLKG